MRSLCESNKIIKNDNTIIDNGLYLFKPDLPIELFVEISKKIDWLNDYCKCMHDAVSNKSSETVGNLKIIETESVNPFARENAEDDVVKWEAIFASYTVAAPIVLLLSFLEWALKVICSGSSSN